MSRPPSQRVQQLYENLVRQLQGGYYPSGSPFLSARAMAQRHRVSYQTAHRLLERLAKEGLIIRRQGSGSYVGSDPVAAVQPVLFFGERAKRPQSFGSRLLEVITSRLESALGSPVQVRLTAPRDNGEMPPENLPVIWEDNHSLETILVQRRYAVLLNETPPPGLSATLIDCVTIDDFSGGVMAAEIARDSGHTASQVLVFGGPEDDVRSNERLRGFRRIYPECPVVHARTWYREEAAEPARFLLERQPGMVFCANDGLADALFIAAAESRAPCPSIIGFDNAPIARERGLTSIAIPWEEFAEATSAMVRHRLSGSSHSATCRIISPRPVLRESHLRRN